ncbi:MAG: DUF2628 domain-containing protein [Alphaproteobacteria bacterium]|jgi:hypothetical protein|nr:DUF2628 domain-containing protein [Alphaproteobacteria bacterium]MBT7943662.1 DUF2628 domain-containing protein [Alphaproteobacteria bacterium]
MKLYAVHLRRHGLDPDRDVVLVKEGFSWPAFFLSFVWALWHRMWAVAIGFLAAQGAVFLAVFWLHPDPATQTVLVLGLAVLLGWIANDLRQQNLINQGFALTAVASGNNTEAAYHRFLDSEPTLAADLTP